MSSPNQTLEGVLFRHNNDFGFNPTSILSKKPRSVPNASIVVPYYETGPTIKRTLTLLYRAIRNVIEDYPTWQFELLLLDDGSTIFPAADFIELDGFKNLLLEYSPKNQGRSRTRNEGLKRAKWETCLFIDSDIFVDELCLLRALQLYSHNDSLNANPAIVVAFFETSEGTSILHHPRRLRPGDLNINDFRISCTYEASWIGCQADHRHIGKSFKLVEDTQHFRKWEGMIGPWCLPNMVLGGFFLVHRDDSMHVRGFDSMFAGYGFTETPLPTKLIAVANHFLIPQPIGGAVHFESNPSHLSQTNRNKNFKDKHRLFFNDYLKLKVSESLTREFATW